MNLTQVCTLERPPLLLKARTAADLMTPNPVSLREEVTAREAARFLTDRGFGAAPVINEAGEPVGVLSQTDIVVHARERIDALSRARRFSRGGLLGVRGNPCRLPRRLEGPEAGAPRRTTAPSWAT